MSGEAALQSVTMDDQTVVVACGCSAVQRARLHDALRGFGRLSIVEKLGDISFQSRDNPKGPDLIVMAVSPEGARDVVAIARELRVKCPRAALVAYCGSVRDVPASISALAAAGVHQFIFTDANDRGFALRSILSSARQQCAAEAVLSALRPLVPAPIHPLIEAVLSRPAMVCDVRALADALGVHRKTLFNRCAQAEFVGPAELLTWTRLAMVAYLLETTGFTVENIAIEIGYPSPTALRNTMKRYTGVRPMGIRESGGLERVIDRLRERLRSKTSPNADSARPTAAFAPRVTLPDDEL